MDVVINAAFDIISFGSIIVLVVLGLGIIASMLGTYAIGVVIREVVRGLIGGLYHNVPEPVVGFITVGAVSVSKWRALIIVITAGVIAASYLLLTRTRLGLCIRAALENPALARASGISTGRIYAIT